MKKYLLIGSAALLTTLAVTATVLGDKKPAKRPATSKCCKKMDAAQCKAANKKTCGSTERTHCFDMAMKTKAH